MKRLHLGCGFALARWIGCVCVEFTTHIRISGIKIAFFFFLAFVLIMEWYDKIPNFCLLVFLDGKISRSKGRTLHSTAMASACTTVPSIVVYVTVPNKEAGWSWCLFQLTALHLCYCALFQLLWEVLCLTWFVCMVLYDEFDVFLSKVILLGSWSNIFIILLALAMFDLVQCRWIKTNSIFLIDDLRRNLGMV